MLSVYISSTYLTLLNFDLAQKEKEFIFSEIQFETFDVDAIQLREHLGSLIKEKSIKSHLAVMSISMEHVAYREIQMNNHFSNWRIYRYIQENFHHYFEGCADDFCIDFELVKGSLEESFDRTFKVFIVPKSFIATYMAIFESLGLIVTAVDIDQLALKEFFISLRTSALFPSHLEYIALMVEEETLWMVFLNLHIIRFEKVDLFKEGVMTSVFLDFLKTWRIQNLPVFCLGSPYLIEEIKKQVESYLGFKILEMPFEKEFQEAFDSIKNYPVSCAIHHGLRLRHGH